MTCCQSYTIVRVHMHTVYTLIVVFFGFGQASEVLQAPPAQHMPFEETLVALDSQASLDPRGTQD